MPDGVNTEGVDASGLAVVYVTEGSPSAVARDADVLPLGAVEKVPRDGGAVVVNEAVENGEHSHKRDGIAPIVEAADEFVLGLGVLLFVENEPKSTGKHQRSVEHITIHHGKQERESNNRGDSSK